MPDNPNIDAENASDFLDEEDWQIAFAPYKGNPGAALSLGYRFMVLKEFLALDPPNVRGTIEAVDVAVSALFSYTDFASVARDLFRRAIKGQLTVAEEQKLADLGFKT